MRAAERILAALPRRGVGGGSRQSGFSLVELVVGLMLMSLVLTSIYSVFTTLTFACLAQNVAADVQQVTRVGLDYIVREIRMAGLDPLGTAGAGIEEITATGNKLRFSADRCDQPIGGSGSCDNPAPNGTLEDKSERVTYFYDRPNRKLQRCLYEAWDTVLPDGVDAAATCQAIITNVVPNPDGTKLFTFLDGDGAEKTDNSERHLVRTVRISLTVEEPAGWNKAVSRTYATRIRCRNIGL
jgi:prepilin-type N-terminal cleavage/methylation domain-containing protein